MSKQSMEIALIQYNKKTWSKSALLGFFIGLAIIVPGISGSTVAIIFKLYDQFLYAIGNLFKQFKKCFFFLLPIIIGIIIGLLLGFISVQKLLDFLPFMIIGLFAGLMSGAFPAVKEELKGVKMSTKHLSLLFTGILIPLVIGMISVLLSINKQSTGVFDNVKIWQILLALPIGYVVGITQIVPGLSASALLMAFGWFSSLIDSVHFTYWKTNPQIFFIYCALGIGFLLGLFTFSGFLNFLFKKARKSVYCMIVGLSLGSIITMFFNPDVFKVYASWKTNGIAWGDFLGGIALFLVGAIGAYLLVRYQRKKSCTTDEKENSPKTNACI